GFAGPRVIQQTIGQELPEGFQSSEFFMKKGFVDMIVSRKNLRHTVAGLLGHMRDKN
ncbi:MAG: acetyl-CoA carboxylase carboxyl transferase subunit beta, partial [candidate division Zixibacteria bacterium]|nr:acetyl-CoA carboxylase carboxyl transferase subunit beta [candidate division Zixibacteria bacterium]